MIFGKNKSDIIDTLHLKRTDSTFTLFGKINNDSIFVRLKKKYAKDFLLKNRGFNWVNEYPLNR